MHQVRMAHRVALNVDARARELEDLRPCQVGRAAPDDAGVDVQRPRILEAFEDRMDVRVCVRPAVIHSDDDGIGREAVALAAQIIVEVRDGDHAVAPGLEQVHLVGEVLDARGPCSLRSGDDFVIGEDRDFRCGGDET